MTRRSRRIIFYLLAILFIVAGTGIIFYAEGWRLDITTLRPEKVGAIFVRSYPVDAQIFLNGKPIDNRAGILSRGTFISDLAPGNYALTLKQDGYDDWTESADVLPSLVTEMKYAVLVPRDATSAASDTVSAFFATNGNIVTLAASGTIEWRGTGILKGTIISYSTDFKNVIAQNASSGIYTLYDFTNATSTNLNSVFARGGAILSPTSTIMIDPFDAGTIIASNGARAWTLNLAGGAVTVIATPVTGTTLYPQLAPSQSFIAWARVEKGSGSSTIVLYDKFSRVIASTSSVEGSVQELKWIKGDELGVLLAGGALYRYDIPSRIFTKLADDVKDFYPTTDGAMLAALENRSVEIFSFTTNDYYRFNLPDMGAVQNLIWYRDENHLFAEYSDHVSLLDFNDAGLHNFVTVANGTAPSYDPSSNSLYLIDPGQKLVRLDFPR